MKFLSAFQQTRIRQFFRYFDYFGCFWLIFKRQPGLQISAKNRLRKRLFFRIKKRSESENQIFFCEANSLRFAIFRNPAKIAKFFFELEFLKNLRIFLEFMSLFMNFMSRSSDQLSQYVPARKSTIICFFRIVNLDNFF